MTSTIYAGMGGIILLFALVLGVVLTSAASSSQTVELTPTLTPDAIATTSPEATRFGGPPPTAGAVAVDTNTEGNSESLLGDLQPCTQVTAGSEVIVDVTVEDLPAETDGAASGASGFQFTITYDPGVLAVASVDPRFLLTRNPGADLVDLTPIIPQQPGKLTVAAADFSPGENETGAGILARVSFRAVGLGSSALTLSDVLIAGSAEYVYPPGALHDGEVRVGASCETGSHSG